MVHRKILEKTKCTPEKLREIFTCKDTSSPHYKIRQRWEEWAQGVIQQGAGNALKNARKYQAVDMAWDSTPILDETFPLLLWAQGKIDHDACVKSLGKIKGAEKYLKKVKVKDAAGKEREGVQVDLPRFYEININLIRAYCTRGMAAQTARFSSLWPYFTFEPRGVDEVSKLRGEALSERIDAMCDAYNYRHLCPQGYRHMFLYARSVMFPRSAWDKKIGWMPKDPDAEEIEMVNFTEREGVDFVLPHPSRVFYDQSAPLANINSDTGPNYIGYWDLLPYRTLLDPSTNYFNVDDVTVSDGFTGLFESHPDYFAQYFDPCVLKHPEMQASPADGNDRIKQIGRYASNDGDKGCLVVSLFRKVNPKQEGIGDLNCDVWVRLSIGGDRTIVAAEFMPSRPACYGGINECDDRIMNQSRAMELMQYQDQMTNICSQMLYNLRSSAVQIWAIDEDAFGNDEAGKAMKAYIQECIKDGTIYKQAQAWFYSGSKLKEAGMNSPDTGGNRAFLQIIQADVRTKMQESMQAMSELLNLVDRLMVVSPNELGQPNPREVAAREVTEIATSVSAMGSFISDGIDEQRAAMKKLLFESLICFGTQEVRVPVISRFTAKTIRDAGFRIDGAKQYDDATQVPLQTPIIGKVSKLNYDYYFNSRDGADRPVNSQGAQVLGNTIAQFMQIPALAKAIGKKRIFEWANEVNRLSGAKFDLKLEDGESESMDFSDGAPPALEGRLAKLEEAMTKIITLLSGGQGQPGQPPTGAPAALPAGPIAAPSPQPPALGDGEEAGAE